MGTGQIHPNPANSTYPFLVFYRYDREFDLSLVSAHPSFSLISAVSARLNSSLISARRSWSNGDRFELEAAREGRAREWGRVKLHANPKVEGRRWRRPDTRSPFCYSTRPDFQKD